MSRANVDHTTSSHFDMDWGFLCQLEKIAQEGGFIGEGTEEEIGMQKSATRLIRLAQKLLVVREQLLFNSAPKLKVV
jgi:hypothetical protein